MYVDGVYKKEALIFIAIGWNMLKLLLPAFANLIQTLQVNELVLICCRFATCPLLFCIVRDVIIIPFCYTS